MLTIFIIIVIVVVIIGALGVITELAKDATDKLLIENELHWDNACRVYSPSSRIALAFIPSSYENKGQIALIRGDKRVWTKNCVNPDDAIVTDGGLSYVVDQRLAEERSFILSYSHNGELIDKKEVNAYTRNCGTSLNDKVGWFELDRDKGVPLSAGRLMLIRLSMGKIIATIDDPRDSFYALKGAIIDVIGNTTGFSITTENNVTANLDLNGTVLNSDKLEGMHEEMRQSSTDGYVLSNLADEILINKPYENMEKEEKEHVIDLLQRANGCDNISDNTQALIGRTLGNFALHDGDINRAIECFEVALQWNPKVGVKRLLAKLKEDT